MSDWTLPPADPLPPWFPSGPGVPAGPTGGPKPPPGTKPPGGHPSPPPKEFPNAPPGWAQQQSGAWWGDSAPSQSWLEQTLYAQFPWIQQMGLADQIRQWAADPSVTVDGLVTQLRQTSQYKSYMQGIFNDDGTMRMDEATFLAQRDQMKQVMRNYSRGTVEYDKPDDFKAFFDAGIDPQQLDTRLKAYDQITRSGQDVKDAFYVYAGMKLTNDDVYKMTVNPEHAADLTNQYNANVASSPLDYGTWITRATEAGLGRVVTTLTDLQKQGVATGNAIDQVRQLDPTFARQLTDALYHGQSATGPFLSLNELMHTVEYSLIGGAALQSGLSMPTQARLDALRAAGVDRAQALKGYGEIAAQQNQLQGALGRANLGQFSQADFEKAVFLNSAHETDLLNRAQAGDKALSVGSGAAGFQQSQSGQIAQGGLYYKG